MSENQVNKSPIKITDVQHNKFKEARPRSTKLKYNENKIKNILNSIKVSSNNKNPYNLRYSLDKTKLSKDESRLAKVLLSSDTKLSLKFHKVKAQENESNKLLLEDKIKLKNIEEKIKQQKKIMEEKKKQLKELNENNANLKESIKQKENNIETIKKNINDYKKLNEEINEKIDNLKNHQNNNNLVDSSLDYSNNLDDINFENSRDREDAINYFLSMMIDLPQQHYPNVDNMTYEELLELEERIGKVSNGLTDEETKKLKHEKFIKYKYLDDKCIICQYIFKELETIVVLPCKHCFHFSCLKPWISKEHHCPLCKRNIREEEK